MDADFGNDFITVEDEDGTSFELELIYSMEIEGEDYALFLPADMDESDPDFGYIILQVTYTEEEEIFTSIDEEDKLVAVYDMFMEALEELDEQEAE